MITDYDDNVMLLVISEIINQVSMFWFLMCH